MNEPPPRPSLPKPGIRPASTARDAVRVQLPNAPGTPAPGPRVEVPAPKIAPPKDTTPAPEPAPAPAPALVPTPAPGEPAPVKAPVDSPAPKPVAPATTPAADPRPEPVPHPAPTADVPASQRLLVTIAAVSGVLVLAAISFALGRASVMPVQVVDNATVSTPAPVATNAPPTAPEESTFPTTTDPVRPTAAASIPAPALPSEGAPAPAAATASTAPPEGMRVWTDRSGKHIEAALVEATPSTATLAAADGSRKTLPREIFSPVDLLYIDEFLGRNAGPSRTTPEVDAALDSLVGSASADDLTGLRSSTTPARNPVARAEAEAGLPPLETAFERPRRTFPSSIPAPATPVLELPEDAPAPAVQPEAGVAVEVEAEAPAPMESADPTEPLLPSYE